MHVRYSFCMEALVYLNALFSVFADGTYPVRPFLFFAFLLLLAAVFFVARKGIVLPHRFLHAAKIIAVTSVCVLFAINFVAGVVLFQAHDIPQSARPIFFDGSSQTITMTAHNHVGKAMIGAVARQFYSGPPLSADTGAGIVPVLPVWLPRVEAFLFLVGIFSLLAIFPELLSHIHGRARVWFFLLYGLSVFIVLDKVVDGGILNDAAFLATVVSAAILFTPLRRFLVWFWWSLLAYAWIIAGAYLVGMYTANSVLFADSIERTLIYGACAVALYLFATTERTRIGVVLLALALIASGVTAYPNIRALHSYLTLSIDPARSYAASYEPLPGLTRVASIGKLGIYDLHPLAGISFGDFFAQDNLAVWRIPVSHDGVLCANPPYVVSVSFTLLTPEAAKILSYGVPNIGNIMLAPSGKDPAGWNVYQTVLMLNPCAPERYAVLREFVLGTGVSSAAIYGLTDARYPTKPVIVNKQSPNGNLMR